MLLLGRGVEKGVVCGDALAAVAVSTGAMAQATISGNLNINALSNSKLSATNSSNVTTNTKVSSTGLTEGWTASQVAFSGTEDLGGGLKASFVAAIRLNQSLDQAVGGGRDTNIALSGGFGTVRVGRFVPATTMGFHGFSGAATTNQAGSVYALGSGGSTGAANFGGGYSQNLERNSNQIQYTTPNFNGFTANVLYSRNTSDSDATAATGKTRGQGHGVSIAYAAGALSVGAGMNNGKFDTEAGAANVVCVDGAGAVSLRSSCGSTRVQVSNASSADALQAIESKTKIDHDWIGASYNLGVATVMGTHVKRKEKLDGATTADIAVTSLGVSVPMGAFTFNASTYTGKNNLEEGTTDDLKLSGHQLSVRYALSKRTMIYAAMGENKTKRKGGNTTGATQKFTSNAVGLMHSF